jgi:hypothetical protein
MIKCAIRLLLLVLFFLQAMPLDSSYNQPVVCGPLARNDVICFVGDSLVGRGDGTFQQVFNDGWITKFRQMQQAYHPEYNFSVVNAGYAYLSSTVLNYPGYGSNFWNQYVVACHPTVLFIWVGIDDMLAGNGSFDMSAYGVNLQNIIDAARQIPTVRQIVLITPACYGEKRNGQNPYDSQIYNLIAVINQTSINNQIPVIDMRSAFVCADLYYNGPDLKTGILCGDIPYGIHPICSTAATPPDRNNFDSSTGSWLIATDIFQALGE